MKKQNYKSPFLKIVALSAEDVVRTSSLEEITKTDGEFIMEDIFYGKN